MMQHSYEEDERLAFNDWCKSEEAQKLAAKKWQTDSFDGVYSCYSCWDGQWPLLNHWLRTAYKTLG